MGIISNRQSAADWDADFQLAKSAGIDAFALNIGTDEVDPFNNEQLNYAYESAANNGMKVFISFDYNYWGAGSAQAVGEKVATYGVKEGQLKIGDKVFVSTFIGGDKLDVGAMKSASGLDLYVVPNFYPGQDYSNVEGAFNWAAWPSDGNNNPPAGTVVSVNDQDNAYVNALGDKAYMARMSPVVTMPVKRCSPSFFQLLRLGSLLTLEPKSATARTGSSPATYSGTSAGSTSSPCNPSMSRSPPGTITASRTTLDLFLLSTRMTAHPSG